MQSESRVALQYLQRSGMQKQAGEVRFIKDRGDSKDDWGWGAQGQSSPGKREMGGGFDFNPKNLKPLAKVLRASLLAMGHAISAHDDFARIKSAQVSPDGNLGGRGYVQRIAEMRRQLMNVIEALSAFTDTVYDEVKAPHWNPNEVEQDPRERAEVTDIMTDVEEIREDPGGFAEKEEESMDNTGAISKKAMLRVASRYLSRR